MKNLATVFNTRILLNLIYPPLCIHCEHTLEGKRTILCATCLEYMTPLTCDERCLTCFAEVQGRCERCMLRAVVIRRQAAACQAIGPALTLTSRLERGELHLLPALSSLLILQWTRLNWPCPDLIVPMPVSWWNRSQTGGDVNALLAKKLAQVLEVPLLSPLKLAWNILGEEATFKLHTSEKTKLSEKRILLVSLKLNDSHLRQAAEALQEAFPSYIAALAFSV